MIEIAGEKKEKLTGYPSIDKPWLKYYCDEVVRGVVPECSIYEYMYENNRDYPNDTALLYFGRKISFAELFESIDRVAAAFQAIGVKEGDIVTVALPNIPEMLYAVYALNKIGAVANMIHLLAGRNEIIGYLNEVGSKIAVIFDKTMEIIGDGILETSVEQAIVVTAANSMSLGTKVLYYLKCNKTTEYKKPYRKWLEFIKNENITDLKAYKKNCRTMAIISHTGGTTGEPKGVMCSDYNINSLIYQIKCNHKYERQDVCVVVLPPFVNYSLVESMMGMLCIGFSVVLIPKFEPERQGEYIKKYKPFIMFSIPAYWEALLNIKNIRSIDMSSLHLMIYGGEGMRSETEAAVNTLLKECGAKGELFKGVGSTEMMAASTQTYEDCNFEGSSGVPLVWVNCKIVEPGTFNELTYNCEGEICFSGPTLMLGYYNKRDATDEVIKIHSDGERWLHTGDLGHIDENGVLFVTGRIKRIIMTKGQDGIITKFFPDRIEKAIYKDTDVELCCVVGVPDKKRINYPKAFVVLKSNMEGTEAKKQSIIEYSRNNLPEYMVPEEIEFVDDMPRTPRGKIDYRALENIKRG